MKSRGGGKGKREGEKGKKRERRREREERREHELMTDLASNKSIIMISCRYDIFSLSPRQGKATWPKRGRGRGEGISPHGFIGSRPWT